MIEFFSTTPLQIGVAFAIDLVLGDPRFLPHPARWTGKIAKLFEAIVSTVLGRSVLSGLFFWILVCGVQVAAALGVVAFLPENVWWWVEVWIIYQCFAAMDMHKHVRAIMKPLRSGDISLARQKLGWIVGRDTDGLSEREISRATIESVGESACDSVLAPLFWTSVLGPFGALIYRITNTLDSIVGHRGEVYGKFGKWSARADDVLNLIPARLVALLTQPYRLGTVWREARAHKSPNAGWGEAAIAYSLNVKLGGENRYGGKVMTAPTFNAEGDAPDVESISRSLIWWWMVVVFGLLVTIGISWIR